MQAETTAILCRKLSPLKAFARPFLQVQQPPPEPKVTGSSPVALGPRPADASRGPLRSGRRGSAPWTRRDSSKSWRPSEGSVRASRIRYSGLEATRTCKKRLDQEAEAAVNELWALGEYLDSGDPATVREVFRRLVERIECRWEPAGTNQSGTRTSYRLVGDTVYLWDPEIVTCARHAEA